jgi:hypothetical protein
MSPSLQRDIVRRLYLAATQLIRISQHLFQFFHIGLLGLDPALQQHPQRRILAGQRQCGLL